MSERLLTAKEDATILRADGTQEIATVTVTRDSEGFLIRCEFDRGLTLRNGDSFQPPSWYEKREVPT